MPPDRTRAEALFIARFVHCGGLPETLLQFRHTE